jgi:hypothetical protein
VLGETKPPVDAVVPATRVATNQFDSRRHRKVFYLVAFSSLKSKLGCGNLCLIGDELRSAG